MGDLRKLLLEHKPIDCSGGSDEHGKLFCCNMFFGDGSWYQWAEHVALIWEFENG